VAWPSGKAEACKASIPQFESGCHLSFTTSKRDILLYIVPTPIGNLKDITYRAVEVLSNCDYILCEDTRRSAILLNHYQIKKNLKSYHAFNENSQLSSIIRDLENGKDIALISDGGTPGICDPGAVLIKTCREHNISYTALPGPCALTTAFSMWGEENVFFQFLGFMPRKEKEMNTFLFQLLQFQGVSIFYESPQRILNTLSIIEHLAPQRTLLVTRELSKTFEEKIFGQPKDILASLKSQSPKGEFVVIVGQDHDNLFSSLSVEQLLELLQSTFKLPLSDAIKTAAHIRKEPKQAIYKIVHQHLDENS
jgi:16S rRNA (cytidine1402-2'-O)-methyltransferase